MEGEVIIDNVSYIEKTALFNYTCQSRGIVFPLINEYTWPLEVRATLYLLGLLYCFLGVAIIADIFMGSIEKITSKTKKVYLATTKDDDPEVIEVRIWSDAVANLTLMALGSSAPEILLSIIEVIGNNFEAGALGPSTIVGSAAFNLFVITAICVVSIPEGETRRIHDMKVFGVTAVFSIIAYLWLLLMLVAISPGEVEIWESVVTLILFPLLVALAWIAEKNFCGVPNKTEASKQLELGSFQPGENATDQFLKDKQYFRNGRMDRDGLVAFIKEVKKYPGLTDEDAAVLAASKLVESQPHSRMWYRVGAVRSMTGGRKTLPQMSTKLKQVYNVMNEHPDAPTLGEVPKVEHHTHAIIDFHATSCAVMENIGKFEVQLCRTGRVDNIATIRVETIDGTATVDTDYVGINEMVTFHPGEIEKKIIVEIINDNQWEPDEEFYVKLALPLDPEKRMGVQLGRISIMEITILNDDEPGSVTFPRRGFLVKESIGKAIITVLRKNGADGEVSVKWRTVDKTALNGRDYEGGEGILVFKHTEIERQIEIPIIDDMEPEKDEHFEVELFDPENGLKLGQINRTAVTITNDDDFNNVLSHLMNLTNANLDAIKVTHETYMDQIKDALSVNGGKLDEASGLDYALHFLTFGWKIIFSLVPPPSILGGWLCFFVSLAFVGLLTLVIGDLAAILGCLIGLKDPVTAITFVALGTSLPDAFASKSAAVQEKYADNAVGNVTGSNSVNVFLGIGIPWLIASIYHAATGSIFRVKAGDLGFSVALFTGLSITCLGLLMLRRYLSFFGKAELGGPAAGKYVTFVIMVTLWLIYVIVSSLKTYEHI